MEQIKELLSSQTKNLKQYIITAKTALQVSLSSGHPNCHTKNAHDVSKLHLVMKRLKKNLATDYVITYIFADNHGAKNA